MIIRKFCKSSLLLMAVVCAGAFVSCDDEEEKEHNWSCNIPSMIVANGDYLTSSVYGSSDYDFNVNYYWDGMLIQTTDKNTGLNYLVSNQSLGDHKLRVEATGEVKGISDFYIQVYEKERGFLGCNLIPSNRELKNGESLQGEVIYYPPTSEKGYMTVNTTDRQTFEKWNGTIKSVKIWIDDDKGNPVKTIESTPWRFSVPVNGLSKGLHKLIVGVDGVGLLITSLEPGGVGGITFNLPQEYEFTITE